MSNYMILNPNVVSTTARTVCQMYVVPLTRSVEPEGPMQPARAFIVPNIVHFIRYGSKPLTFIDAVCILAALKQQRPHKVYVHTDQKDFQGGKYWKVVSSHRLGRGVVELKHLQIGQTDMKKSVSDSLIVKLKIMKKYGGIYLDNDCYLVNSLNKFRRHELTLGWVRHSIVPHNVIIASSEAKFLPIWIEEATKMDPGSFSRQQYNAYFTLKNKPSLVNWMREWMIDSQEVVDTVYLDLSNRWKFTNVIKLFINAQYLIPRNLSHKATYPVDFNEINILRYHANIKLMVKDVYPLEEKIIPTTNQTNQ